MFAEETYENGKLVYERKYYPDGKIKSDLHYLDDKLHVKRKDYYETGELESEGVYKDNEPTGINKEYYKNGKLKTEWYYKEGNVVRCKAFNEDGTLYYEQARNPATGKIETEFK